MEMIVYALLLGAGGVGQVADEPVLVRYQEAQLHMGVSFKIILYASNEDTANRAFAAAFTRIDQLNSIMSDYDAQSELSRLSQSAGQGKKSPLSNDLWQVLYESQNLSRRSNGAFDITVGPLTKLWRRARRQKKAPAADRLAETRKAVGYQYLRLDSQDKTAQLLRPRMRLDLGGIAKGYAADEALKTLKKHGIRRALVNASGDIVASGPPPGEPGWKIGIAPLKPQSPPSKFVKLANSAIATSGDAWQFIKIDGQRYSHILDPKTGMGVVRRSSVTVLAPSCMIADSLASAVSVLGPQQGLMLIEKTCGVECLIVVASDDANSDGKQFRSSGAVPLIHSP